MVATNVKQETAPKIVALKSKKDAAKTKENTLTLFSIDDNEYSIPATIKPNRALQIMHVFRAQGESSGVSFMLETLLGKEGYDALINFDDLESDDLEKIIKIAFQMVAGATENPKAKSSNA